MKLRVLFLGAVLACLIASIIPLSIPFEVAHANNQTKDEIEATISALQTQVSKIEAEEQKTGSHTPTPSSKAEPKSTSSDPIQQTVAALAASIPDGSYKSPTPSTGKPHGNKLEVLQIDARDAGIGNGTIYVYADIFNGTAEGYLVVSLSATCKDSNGSTVGTGYGGVQNLGPGDTATATIIILNVPTCDKYSVRIESAI